MDWMVRPYGTSLKLPILVAQFLYASPFWRGFINAEETNRLKSILNKTIRRSYLPLDFKPLDELLDSADHALFRVIVRNPHHVLHPLLPPRKKTVYNLRMDKLSPKSVRVLCVKTSSSVCMHWRLLTFVCLSILPLTDFYYRHFVCVFYCFCHCNIIAYCHWW